MADGFQIFVDRTAALAALQAIPDAVMRHIKPAEKVTADNICRDQQSRVARATGETARGIHVEETYSGDGYVVLTADVVNVRELTRRAVLGMKSAKSTYYRVPHVGVYLEYGTVKMAAEPFFWAAARLEEGPHQRRMGEAVQDAIDEQGLGPNG